LIQFVNVSKEFKNGLRALDGVDIKVDNGEFVFIVGVSGAGKSTLVKLILKELEPTTGKLLVNDTDLSQMKRKEIPFYRRGIGVVFQDFRLLPEKTVYENVAFAMEVVEAGRKEIRRQVPAVLGMVGLAAKANSFPGQLSGGEQQRTALARALVNNPSILIADEPTGNLDSEATSNIIDLLHQVNEEGTTVIMVTHDVETTRDTRVLRIRDGLIES
jgi:cell division transport system ATP-binding protein